jgi:hypothetical protein
MKMTGQREMKFGDKAVFFYSVDKEEELFKMNFEGVDMFFKSLDLMGDKAIGKAMILFDGYNEVATELYEIPQVRKFVKEMFRRHPQLLVYINFDLEGEKVLLSCLFDVEAVNMGKRMTFAEHAKEYGWTTPMPRYNMWIKYDKNMLAKLMSAMFTHGNVTGLTKLCDKQVNRFMRLVEGSN